MDSLDDHLSLIEVSYINIYHIRIGMEPFEARYGGIFRSPAGWCEVGD